MAVRKTPDNASNRKRGPRGDRVLFIDAVAVDEYGSPVDGVFIKVNRLVTRNEMLDILAREGSAATTRFAAVVIPRKPENGDDVE